MVSWAASNGDRSENGDYLYGKKRLREIDRKNSVFEQTFGKQRSCRSGYASADRSSIFGATVLFSDEDGNESRIRIVGIDEADATVEMCLGFLRLLEFS